MTIEFRSAYVDLGDGAVLIGAMRDEMRELYAGLELDGEAMPKAGPAELGPPGGAFVVGYEDGAPICCGGVKRLDPEACEIKRMYVAPAARGRGVARELLHRLEDVARELGYTIARLDTGPRQPSARHLYESEGYVAGGNFNANPVATFFGSKPL
jgi:GNAT superfamily N-acetyltransferase